MNCGQSCLDTVKEMFHAISNFPKKLASKKPPCSEKFAPLL